MVLIMIGVNLGLKKNSASRSQILTENPGVPGAVWRDATPWFSWDKMLVLQKSLWLYLY
jgi:hypothetical protein